MTGFTLMAELTPPLLLRLFTSTTATPMATSRSRPPPPPAAMPMMEAVDKVLLGAADGWDPGGAGGGGLAGVISTIEVPEMA